MYFHAPHEPETTLKKPQHLRIIAAALIAAGIASVASTGARAETVVDTTAPGFSANPRLDFRIIIPGFLRFRVGTAGATVDQITFDMTATPQNVGSGVSQPGAGGDVGGGAVNVLLQANNGPVTITPTNNGTSGLGTGTASDGYINYAQISTAVTVDTDLTAPTLSNAGGTPSTPTVNAGKVTNRTAVWTYGYLNTTIPSSGTYGTVTNGGQVTYTATTP